jgi:hypothetical protein
MSVRGDVITSIVDVLGFWMNDGTNEKTTVIPYEINLPSDTGPQPPIVMLIDNGLDKEILRDATNARYQMSLIVRGVVKAPTVDGVVELQNAMIRDLRDFAEDTLNIDDHILRIRLLDPEANRQSTLEKIGIMADTLIPMQVIYWAPRRNN